MTERGDGLMSQDDTEPMMPRVECFQIKLFSRLIPECGNKSLTHIVRISTQNDTRRCLQIIDYPNCKNDRFGMQRKANHSPGVLNLWFLQVG